MKATQLDAYKLFHESTLSFAKMERVGMRIDTEYLDNTIKKVDRFIKRKTKKLENDKVWTLWKREYGRKANMFSGVQLGNIVFNKLGYECKFRTAISNQPKTDVTAFEHIDLPFVKDLIDLEKYKHAKNNFLLGIKRETVDGVLRPSFNLNTAKTMRGSVDSPNSNNWPIRSKVFGKMIRDCFIPRDGNVLVEMDYGALEFKICAMFWKDRSMIEYASDPKKDVHGDQAMECYLLSREEVSKDSRYCAKNKFVFPILYGSYYIQCARHLWEAIDLMNLKTKDKEIPLKEHLAKKGITKLGACNPKEKPKPGTFEKHIKDVEDNFNAKFPSFGDGKERWWNLYQKRGWFDQMTGFRIHGQYSRNFLLNCPIQGPGFHCLLFSINNIIKKIIKLKMKSRIINQIHDCFIADVPVNELQDFLSMAKYIMIEKLMGAWSWVIVPMLVEADIVPIGKTWNDKESYVEDKGVWKPKSEVA